MTTAATSTQTKIVARFTETLAANPNTEMREVIRLTAESLVNEAAQLGWSERTLNALALATMDTCFGLAVSFMQAAA